MATYGHVGKIALVDLGTGSVEEFETEKYEQWVGGHGLATALFWDHCKDKTVDAFDPGNLVVIASNPFSGTFVPAAGARVEITGISSYSIPQWYSRSSMGGRLAGAMKQSGFDAFMVTGKAAEPVWISVVNGEISIQSAKEMWGLDTWETQKAIWSVVTRGAQDGDWYDTGDTRDSGRTTQKPGVICIGPAGENLVRQSTLNHDAGHAAGQSGLGAVFGSKNLKAISFSGTGSITVADPAALYDIRMEMQEQMGYDPDDPAVEYQSSIGMLVKSPGWAYLTTDGLGSIASRPEGCQGCFRNCRRNFDDSVGNEGYCAASIYHALYPDIGSSRKTVSLLNRLGLNGFDYLMPIYLYTLNMMGVAGPGLQVDTEDLDFAKYFSYQFMEHLLTKLAYREGKFGDDLAEGLVRATKKWGRFEEDSATGILPYPQWGYTEHYDPRIEVDWSYGSIIGERDINEHSLNYWVHHMPGMCKGAGIEPPFTPEETANLLAEATHLDDPMCFDYSVEGIYSDARLRAVQWHRHYSRFWMQSMGFCDFAWPMFVNINSRTDNRTVDCADYEVRLFKAVTGRDLTHQESLELGHKIFTLDRAIWSLQGRHRDLEVFSEYVYSVPTTNPYDCLAYEDGQWLISQCLGRTLDRARFEDVKTRFYTLEGWDPATGWPTRATLEEMGLTEVADALQAAGKLGA